MKKEIKLKLKVITSNSVAELEEKVNDFFTGHKIKHVDYDRTPLEFSAFINYEETINLPENIKDEYNLKGVFYCCEDCPYWGTNYKEVKSDGKREAFKCNKGVEYKPTRPMTPACLWFYESIARGDVKPYVKP